MPVTFDDSLWPLLITRYVGTMSDMEYEKSLERLSSFLQRREPFFMLIDTSRSGIPNNAQRQRQVEWSRIHDELERTWGRGSAFIVTSPFIRAAMSLFFHVRPPGTPYVIVSDMDSALTWILARMESTGFTAEAARVRDQFGSHTWHTG
ncbi:hypothetical protein JQX13_29415 [Archangium violaceum]|uniref:STAS/SEC14 domain-containing protein n=1 Tax=Archangium violaceum TaxID=83451 RepID=UPI00193C06E3|nr:STAS/SEC14 domain-containing protein [Archangium violaceum]QRK04376.1 hypothetical protein JQX13_29415 [Archangium violaceum]